MSLKGIARATLSILKDGGYQAPGGAMRHIGEDLERAIAHTRLYTPEELTHPFKGFVIEVRGAGQVELRGGTTQAVARQLVQDEGVEDLVLLGFASARNVCGGFLNGARSQEEDLARSSGLYACLLTQPDYYTINRAQESLLYTDHMIYSPEVPFFRERNRTLLEEPYLASIITAPAPNAGQFLRKHPEREDEVKRTLQRRARQVLDVACMHGHRHILLGAWGCGVFGNKPAQVISAFLMWLGKEHDYHSQFERVIFAIPEAYQETRQTFEEALTAFHAQAT